MPKETRPVATSAELEPPRSVASPGEYLLWCGTCRRVDTRALGWLTDLARDGWPWCCGRQMFCWWDR